jgi:hypothetical protein
MTLTILSGRSRLARASVVLGGAAALTGMLSMAKVSSHREAPGITEMPKCDATDFYMFTSYEPGRSNFVTLVANYQPLQEAYGGPNYYTMDPDAVYDIKVDNNGDANPDLTFRFRFKNTLRDIALQIGPAGNQKTVSVPLRNVGPITATDDSAQNEIETYTIDLLSGNTSTPIVDAATGSKVFAKPIDNIGHKSIPDYDGYAAAHVYDIRLPGNQIGRVFVGQRKDPFVVNLGPAFDLINLNPLGPVNGAHDALEDANVTSLILELPKSFVVLPNQPILGGWTTASLPRKRFLQGVPSYAQPTIENGELVQVSRLGSPLVNELVIGLKDKNKFNASRPNEDLFNFADYVTHPTLPALIEALFGVQAPTQFPRTDLVQVFVTGIPGLTENGAAGEMLRLNTSIAPTPIAQQSNLGVLGGDLAGYPNGRRPGDDVVDMSLRVVMGVLLPANVAPAGQLPYTDGAYLDATFFDNQFPYIRTPIAGAL